MYCDNCIELYVSIEEMFSLLIIYFNNIFYC